MQSILSALNVGPALTTPGTQQAMYGTMFHSQMLATDAERLRVFRRLDVRAALAGGTTRVAAGEAQIADKPVDRAEVAVGPGEVFHGAEPQF